MHTTGTKIRLKFTWFHNVVEVQVRTFSQTPNKFLCLLVKMKSRNEKFDRFRIFLSGLLFLNLRRKLQQNEKLLHFWVFVVQFKFSNTGTDIWNWKQCFKNSKLWVQVFAPYHYCERYVYTSGKSVVKVLYLPLLTGKTTFSFVCVCWVHILLLKVDKEIFSCSKHFRAFNACRNS